MKSLPDSSYQLLKQRHAVDMFIAAVVISILLHLAASSVLMLPGRQSLPLLQPLFVELNNIEVPPAPADPAVQEQSLPISPAQPEIAPLPQELPETARITKTIESSLQKAVRSPEAVHESSIGLGMISGHFASFAEGETLRDDIRAYYFDLMRRINEIWWTSGTADKSFRASASLTVTISRDGKVVGCDLLQSSGSREQDQALIEALKKAEPLPPLPESYQKRLFTAPIRFVPPLRLMFPGFGPKTASPQ